MQVKSAAGNPPKAISEYFRQLQLRSAKTRWAKLSKDTRSAVMKKVRKSA